MRKKNIIFVCGILGLAYVLVLFITTDGFQKWKFNAPRDTNATAYVAPGVGFGMEGGEASQIKSTPHSNPKLFFPSTSTSYSLSSSEVNTLPVSDFKMGSDVLFSTSSGTIHSCGDNGMGMGVSSSVAFSSASSSNSSTSSISSPVLSQSMPLIAQVGQYHSPINRAFSNDAPQSVRGKQAAPQKKMAKTMEDWENTDEDAGNPLPVGTPILPLLLLTVAYGAFNFGRIAHFAG